MSSSNGRLAAPLAEPVPAVSEQLRADAAASKRLEDTIIALRMSIVCPACDGEKPGGALQFPLCGRCRAQLPDDVKARMEHSVLLKYPLALADAIELIQRRRSRKIRRAS